MVCEKRARARIAYIIKAAGLRGIEIAMQFS